LVPSPAGLMTVFYCLTALAVVQLRHFNTLKNVREPEFRVTLRLAVYRQSVRLGAEPLEAHDQVSFFFFFFFATELFRS
jgi:hypothetical protein